MSAANSEFRLPLNVKPTHYDLTIVTDLNALTFEGLVKTSLHVNESTSTIVANANDIILGEASLYSHASGKTLTQTEQSLDAKSKRVSFTFPESVPADSKVDLKVAFKGELGDGMTGYYKASYTPDGETKHYALTQFESTDARRAFPCWDEPALKATFAVTMISRVDSVNLSNMPVISEEPYDHATSEFSTIASSTDKWKITKFETTPLMSSYLLAFANGDFKYLETSVKMPLSGRTVPLRIYTTPDLIHQAQFALDVKAKALPLYESIFDVEFPLPKLDTLVATDFDAGAMENWGLITGRTTVFLLDPNNVDIKTKKYVVTVQSHEVAHMWFGNITTMEWWDYLYLNEGFATLMGEVIIPNRMFPEFKPNSEFINQHLNAALSLDAKLSSHPIEVPCPDAEAIGQIFDSLSYSKAGSVLRMLLDYVGEEKFLKGVSLYLKAHLFGNSVTNDLWEGISKSTGLDIVSLMDNWISKTGFPVLTVTDTPNGITVRQDRFLESGPPKPEDNTTIWNVPLALTTVTADGHAIVDKSAILQEREKTFTVDTTHGFKLNGGTSGVYRVLYTPERLTKIAIEAAKENSAFSSDDRLGLVLDSVALSKAGLAKLSSSLTLIDILRHEKEYLIWSGIAGSLGSLKTVWWEHKEITESLKLFIRSLFVPLVDKLGYEYKGGEDPDLIQLRTLAIGAAAGADAPEVVAELKRRFSHFAKTGDASVIPPDLQPVIYTTAVKHGGTEEYEAVVKISQNPPTPTHNVSAKGALAATRDSELLKRTFDTILHDSRDSEVLYFYRGFAGNAESSRQIADFFKTNYAAFDKRFAKNFSMTTFVPATFSTLSTKEDYESTKAFFQDKDTSKYHMALNQTLDGIQARIDFKERSTEDLEAWLKQWKSKI